MKAFKIFIDNSVEYCRKHRKREPEASVFTNNKMVHYSGKADRRRYNKRGSKI